MSVQINIVCDSCGIHHSIALEGMDMPPYWFSAVVAISDKDGFVPMHERDIGMHFCSQECFTQFAKSKELRERKCMVDKKFDDDGSGHPESGNEPNVGS